MELLRNVAETTGGDAVSWLQQNAAWIALLLAPVGVWLGIVMTRKTGKETVNVSEKDADTRAVANVIDALTVGLAELRTEIKDQKEKSAEDKAEADERIRCLEEEVDILRAGREQLLTRLGELVGHLAQVEKLVPNPPGAPPRPPWKELTDMPDDAFL